jgi:DNA polymerase II small subunit/DNA polymerase delta subunit B
MDIFGAVTSKDGFNIDNLLKITYIIDFRRIYMRINLVEAEEDNDLEIIFSKSGDTIFWSEEDSAVFYIEDFNASQVCIGVGSIDTMIKALVKLKERVNDK